MKLLHQVALDFDVPTLAAGFFSWQPNTGVSHLVDTKNFAKVTVFDGVVT